MILFFFLLPISQTWIRQAKGNKCPRGLSFPLTSRCRPIFSLHLHPSHNRCVPFICFHIHTKFSFGYIFSRLKNPSLFFRSFCRSKLFLSFVHVVTVFWPFPGFNINEIAHSSFLFSLYFSLFSWILLKFLLVSSPRGNFTESRRQKANVEHGHTQT